MVCYSFTVYTSCCSMTLFVLKVLQSDMFCKISSAIHANMHVPVCIFLNVSCFVVHLLNLYCNYLNGYIFTCLQGNLQKMK